MGIENFFKLLDDNVLVALLSLLLILGVILFTFLFTIFLFKKIVKRKRVEEFFLRQRNSIVSL